MKHACSFCSTPLREVTVTEATFSLCPTCFSTFIKAKQFGSIRIAIDEGSRKEWLDFLRTNDSAFKITTEHVVCIEHGQELVEGQLPGVCVPGKCAPCCDMLHLPPSTMEMLLERGLLQPVQTLQPKEKDSGFFKRIFERISLWADKDSDMENVYDGMVWKFSIKPNLQPGQKAKE